MTRDDATDEGEVQVVTRVASPDEMGLAYEILGNRESRDQKAGSNCADGLAHKALSGGLSDIGVFRQLGRLNSNLLWLTCGLSTISSCSREGSRIKGRRPRRRRELFVRRCVFQGARGKRTRLRSGMSERELLPNKARNASRATGTRSTSHRLRQR